MFSTLRKAFLVFAGLAVAVSMAMPTSVAAPGMRLLVTLLSCALILFSMRIYRPTRSLRTCLAHPDPWELLALGIFLRALMEALAMGGISQGGTLRTALGLGHTAISGYALLMMSRQRFGDRAVDHFIESSITAGTVGLAAWMLVIEPVLHSTGAPLSVGTGVAVALVAALVLFSVATQLTVSFSERPPAFVLLSAGLLLSAVTALASFTGEMLTVPLLVTASATLPAIAVVLIACGASHSTMTGFEEPCGPAGARLSRSRVANLLLPILLGPCLLILVEADLVTLSPIAIFTFTITLSVAVVAHLMTMVQARASSTHWASHDKLTGLPNRALLRERTAQSLDRARKMGGSVAILYLDLDRFKQINDSLGHEVGDQLLEQVAKRILSCVDPLDTVARLGGDEFAILMPNVEDADIPAKLARRLLKRFSTPFQLKPRPVFMSPSVGIAVSEESTNLETLFTQSDTAMYRAKEAGRNSYAVWSREMNEASKERLMLETHLHAAIANGELHMLYQPKVELSSGRIVGVEALIRWQHPSLGTISPSVFIHLAEETGLIDKIGEWALHTACQQARIWSDAGFNHVTVAVNLSPRQFQHDNVADLVSRTLRATDLSPELLELELTESVAMSGDEKTMHVLNDLRAMGVRSSIDDFGTGYSNLSYLSRFPVDALKIDKAFVERIDRSHGEKSLVLAIIAMAHGLGLKVIAEGVETPEQASFLAEHGCDEMQGYLFSEPVSPTEIESLLMLENVSNGPGRLGLAAAPKPAPRTRASHFAEDDDVYETTSWPNI